MESARTFSLPIRIYYEDTDHSGVVYHPNFLKYFERAREEVLGVLHFTVRMGVLEANSVLKDRGLGGAECRSWHGAHGRLCRLNFCQRENCSASVLSFINSVQDNITSPLALENSRPWAPSWQGVSRRLNASASRIADLDAFWQL